MILVQSRGESEDLAYSIAAELPTPEKYYREDLMPRVEIIGRV